MQVNNRRVDTIKNNNLNLIIYVLAREGRKVRVPKSVETLPPEFRGVDTTCRCPASCQPERNGSCTRSYPLRDVFGCEITNFEPFSKIFIIYDRDFNVSRPAGCGFPASLPKAASAVSVYPARPCGKHRPQRASGLAVPSGTAPEENDRRTGQRPANRLLHRRATFNIPESCGK